MTSLACNAVSALEPLAHQAEENLSFLDLAAVELLHEVHPLELVALIKALYYGLDGAYCGYGQFLERTRDILFTE